MTIMRRANSLHLKKRIPLRYKAVDSRESVSISLHTDSETIAAVKAAQVWQELIEAWEAKLVGADGEAEARLEHARELANRRGYRYMPVAEVARLPRAEFHKRVDAVVNSRGKIDVQEAAALLGSEPPVMTVRRALEVFWVLAAPRTHGKSEDQIRRWRNPRIKAVENFASVVGNKDLDKITADNMLEFRAWWWDRVQAEKLTPNSANKDITHLSDILKTLNKMKRLGLDLPLGGLMLPEGEKRTRPSFSVKWIKDRILAPGALSGLNGEARCIMLGMINTGYRPSEGACLTAAQIKLEGAIPFISIEPVGRTLKTTHSRRVIPLAGVSLEAFRAFPVGFPRYADNPSLSDTVNKFMREAGLMESPDHSLYGFRHSFEDRMLAAGVDERIRRDLFGHALNRERYGSGASLEMAHKIVSNIAL